MEYFSQFTQWFQNGNFMPHGYCYHWMPGLVGLHVISDSLIAIAYLIIPFGLAYFVSHRKDVPFGWIFFCFSMFIFACSATHMMEVWTLWFPNYWMSGVIKAFTAVVSITTAYLLIRLIPAAIKLPSPSLYAQANQALEQEIKFRIEKELALEASNAHLAAALEDVKKTQEQIEKQNIAIRDLSTPVLHLRKELLMLPIVGEMAEARANQLTAQLLEAIQKNRAKVVVIDITGVPIVDMRVATHLIHTVEAAKLMGAQLIISGVSVAVAQTLVKLCVDLSKFITVGDLQSGLEEAERILQNFEDPQLHIPNSQKPNLFSVEPQTKENTASPSEAEVF